MGVEIHIEDKNIVSSRTIKKNLLSYIGPTVKLENLGKPRLVKFMVEFSQRIYLKKDRSKNCEEYPTIEYTSYKHCDEEFIFETMKRNFPFMPVWATPDTKAVTNISVYKKGDMGHIS